MKSPLCLSIFICLILSADNPNPLLGELAEYKAFVKDQYIHNTDQRKKILTRKLWRKLEDKWLDDPNDWQASSETVDVQRVSLSQSPIPSSSS